MYDKVIKYFSNSYEDEHISNKYTKDLIDALQTMKDNNDSFYDVDGNIIEILSILLLEGYYYQALFIIFNLNELTDDHISRIKDNIESYFGDSTKHQELFEEFEPLIKCLRKNENDEEEPFYYLYGNSNEYITIVYLNEVLPIYNSILDNKYTKNKDISILGNGPFKRYAYPRDFLSLDEIHTRHYIYFDEIYAMSEKYPIDDLNSMSDHERLNSLYERFIIGNTISDSDDDNEDSEEENDIKDYKNSNSEDSEDEEEDYVEDEDSGEEVGSSIEFEDA